MMLVEVIYGKDFYCIILCVKNYFEEFLAKAWKENWILFEDILDSFYGLIKRLNFNWLKS